LPFQYPNRRDRSPGREEQRVRDFSKGEERESDYERKKTKKICKIITAQKKKQIWN
jgi:hypothetical protein